MNSSTAGFTASDYIWAENACVHPSDISSPNIYNLQVFRTFMLRPASMGLTLPQDALELTGMGGSASQTHTYNVCAMHILSQQKSVSALKLSLAAPCAFNSALSHICPVTVFHFTTACHCAESL